MVAAAPLVLGEEDATGLAAAAVVVLVLVLVLVALLVTSILRRIAGEPGGAAIVTPVRSGTCGTVGTAGSASKTSFGVLLLSTIGSFVTGTSAVGLLVSTLVVGGGGAEAVVEEALLLLLSNDLFDAGFPTAAAAAADDSPFITFFGLVSDEETETLLLFTPFFSRVRLRLRSL
jgi:hypothetical protein